MKKASADSLMHRQRADDPRRGARFPSRRFGESAGGSPASHHSLRRQAQPGHHICLTSENIPGIDTHRRLMKISVIGRFGGIEGSFARVSQSNSASIP
jgi:hypothetical protein